MPRHVSELLPTDLQRNVAESTGVLLGRQGRAAADAQIRQSNDMQERYLFRGEQPLVEVVACAKQHLGQAIFPLGHLSSDRCSQAIPDSSCFTLQSVCGQSPSMTRMRCYTLCRTCAILRPVHSEPFARTCVKEHVLYATLCSVELKGRA